jgi:hypothetical protein
VLLFLGSVSSRRLVVVLTTLAILISLVPSTARAEPEPSFELLYSESSDRSAPVQLEAASLSADAFPFLWTDATEISQVSFFVDDAEMSGVPFNVDDTAPFDVAGDTGGMANPFDASALGLGSHQVTALVEMPEPGLQVVLTSTFDVVEAIETVVALDVADEKIHFDSESVQATATEPAESVEFFVDDQSVGIANQEVDGSFSVQWETSTVADGMHELVAVADLGGGELETSSPVEIVVNNDLDSEYRVISDYSAGEITADERAVLGMQALVEPAGLPDRYLHVDDDGEADGGLAYQFLEDWESLTPTTQQTVEAMLAYATTTISNPTPQSDWVDCLGYAGNDEIHDKAGMMYSCRRSVSVAGYGTVFEIFYEVEGLDHPLCLPPCNPRPWAEPVAAADTGQLDIPDHIAAIEASLVESWNTYIDMGFRTPNLPMDVIVRDGSGRVLPPAFPFQTANVFLDENTFPHHLPRHELFHAFQYEYVGPIDFMVRKAQLVPGANRRMGGAPGRNELACCSSRC